MTSLQTTTHPIIVGEILFDIFPDGNRILGGAPFNVAWHLQGFGLAPLMISCLGQDAESEQVLRMANAWQLDTQYLQHSANHNTGRVLVSLDDGIPSYELPPEQAYDYIDFNAAAEQLLTAHITPPLLYHGTLAFRQQAYESLLHASQRLNAPIFLDLNLRAPWWTSDLVRKSLQAARWVKLNEEELGLILPTYRADNAETSLLSFCQHYDLDMVVLTRGADGAFLQARGKPLLQASAPPITQIEDTVGAGDAFCAVILAGLLQHWPAEIALARAVNFAARICQQQGAISSDEALYQQVLRDWS